MPLPPRTNALVEKNHDPQQNEAIKYEYGLNLIEAGKKHRGIGGCQ